MDESDRTIRGFINNKSHSHQMIDVETGDYITKPENTKYKYKPCYDKAIRSLKKL